MTCAYHLFETYVLFRFETEQGNKILNVESKLATRSFLGVKLQILMQYYFNLLSEFEKNFQAIDLLRQWS